MSLLQNLALYSHQRDTIQRSHSVDTKNQLANSTMEVCHVVMKGSRQHSKSLSKLNLIDKAQTVRSMSRILNKMFMTLSKKIRTIRYYVFVKLEALKKQGSTLSRKNSQSSASQANQKTQDSSRNMDAKIQRMSQCIQLINLRHYQPRHKETAMKIIKKFNQNRRKHLFLSLQLEPILDNCILHSLSFSFNTLKQHSKQLQIAQLLYSQVNMLIKQQIRQAFLSIKSSSDCPPISYRNELHLPLTDTHDVSQTNNQTLTFSNLIENGDQYYEMPYMHQKRSEHNLDMVIPVQISNIRPQPISMRRYRPLVLEEPPSTKITIRLQNQPIQMVLPQKMERYARPMSRLQPDICINAINQQGDNALIFLDCPQQQPRSLLRNESFINSLKISDVRESTKELRPVLSQQLLKPPLLRQESSSSHDSRRQSQVELFVSKNYGQSEQLTNHTEFLYNPEERRKNQYLTPKRADRVPEGPSTPINQLKIHYPQRQQYRPKNYENQNKISGISYEVPAYKSRTSQFYMQYLRSLRKNNQAEKKQETETLYDPATYFGSRSFKNIGGNS